MTIAQRLADAGIEVKPLEWVESPAREYLYFADIYKIQEIGLGRWWLSIGGVRRDLPFEYCHEAKSAAQADYTTRILSAIQVKP